MSGTASSKGDLARVRSVILEAPSLASTQRSVLWGARRLSLAGIDPERLRGAALARGVEPAAFDALSRAGAEYAQREQQTQRARLVTALKRTPSRRRAADVSQERIQRQGKLFDLDRLAA